MLFRVVYYVFFEFCFVGFFVAYVVCCFDILIFIDLFFLVVGDVGLFGGVFDMYFWVSLYSGINDIQGMVVDVDLNGVDYIYLLFNSSSWQVFFGMFGEVKN